MPESKGTKGDDDGTRYPPRLIETGQSSTSISLPEVFDLGIRLEYLRNLVDPGKEELPTKRQVLDVLERIDNILSNHDAQGILSQLITKQQTWLGEPDSPEARITLDEAEDLEKQAISWIHLITRNLEAETRIPVSESGVLDIDILTENTRELFNPDVWEWLDQRPREDIKESCRSVAVGCATASVMLSLRAVEHCLREWYEQEHESLDAAWGHVLDQLMEEYAEEDKRSDTVLTQLSDLPPVLTTLYYLKEKRNEVNHPEESPTPREARRTLLIVSSTITDIYEFMREEAVAEAEREIQDSHTSLIQFSEVDYSSTPEQQEQILNVASGLDDGDGASEEEIIAKAEESGFSESETEKILEDLMMGGQMYMPDRNSYKVI